MTNLQLAIDKKCISFENNFETRVKHDNPGK